VLKKPFPGTFFYGCMHSYLFNISSGHSDLLSNFFQFDSSPPPVLPRHPPFAALCTIFICLPRIFRLFLFCRGFSFFYACCSLCFYIMEFIILPLFTKRFGEPKHFRVSPNLSRLFFSTRPLPFWFSSQTTSVFDASSPRFFRVPTGPWMPPLLAYLWCMALPWFFANNGPSLLPIPTQRPNFPLTFGTPSTGFFVHKRHSVPTD